MAVNRELFQKIHDVISVRPAEHDQTDWEWDGGSCGTTRCVAGWAVHLTTGEPLYAGGVGITLRPETVDLALGHGVDGEADVNKLIPVTAQRLLGLDDDLAQRLFFYVSNEAARKVVRAFAEGRDHEAASILHEW